MEYIVNALMIRASDYKDNDKILTLYSLEKGKISSGIKGVKKAGAKLKFASEPFCFAEYVLAEKSGRFTIIGASHLDSFYNLRLDMLKYYCSAVVLETINALVPENEPDAQLFALVIETAKKLNYEKSELITLCRYLLNLIDMLGYKIGTLTCQGCGDFINGRVFFNPQTAEFSCLSCRENGFMEITPETYNALNALNESSGEVFIESASLLKLLRFLFFYLNVTTSTNLKSATSLIDYLKQTI
ncbi:MAG: DNA repair protein RecO [Clostridia bacterium]|nr:DNA repair protein RecO [Clostridia bacterium]